MSDASVVVQTTLYTRMDALLAVPVHDHVPQDTVHSFVVIGEGQEFPDDTKTYDAVEHLVEINVYSAERGMKEVKTIIAQIYDNMHRKDFTVAGFNTTRPQFDSKIMFPEPDGTRGVIRFRFTTSPS